MRRVLASLGRVSAGVAIVILNPIAWPAWVFEWVVRRIRPTWEFDQYSASPYFLSLAGLSAWWMTSGPAVLEVLGLYVVTSLQVLALWVCLSLAIGRMGQVAGLLVKYGRRRSAPPESQSLPLNRAIYIGAASYAYTVFYFGLVYHLIFRISPASFDGVVARSTWSTAWEFMYFSLVTITTLGYGDIAPRHFPAQAAVVAEVFLGLFFVVFLFGAMVAFNVSRDRSNGFNHH